METPKASKIASRLTSAYSPVSLISAIASSSCAKTKKPLNPHAPSFTLPIPIQSSHSQFYIRKTPQSSYSSAYSSSITPNTPLTKSRPPSFGSSSFENKDTSPSSSHTSDWSWRRAKSSPSSSSKAYRCLVLSNLPKRLGKEELLTVLSAWGDINMVEEGINQLSIYFYDIRDAQRVHDAIVSGDLFKGLHPLAQKDLELMTVCYRRTMAIPYLSDVHTATLYVKNPPEDSTMLEEEFRKYGALREIRTFQTTTEKGNQLIKNFVEYFDIRSAIEAYFAMNGIEVCGYLLHLAFARNNKGNNVIKDGFEPSSKMYNIHRKKPQAKRCLFKDPVPKETNEYDSDFNVEEANSSSSTARKTLMIHNIPGRYSRSDFIEMLDNHCLLQNAQIMAQEKDVDEETQDGDENFAQEPMSEYDFVYLPIDIDDGLNLGYAFVNFTTAKATLRFYMDFNNMLWSKYESPKRLQIAYARVQGKEVNVNHLENATFYAHKKEHLPIAFDPPGNGSNDPQEILVGKLKNPHPLTTEYSDDVLVNGNPSFLYVKSSAFRCTHA